MSANSKRERCSHALSFAQRCIECELISARESLAWARADVEQYSKLVVKLEAEQVLAVKAALTARIRE